MEKVKPEQVDPIGAFKSMDICITMIQRCQIQLDDQVIQSFYETRSSISWSYLPSLNMSQRIEQLNNKTLKLQAISTDLEIDELQRKLDYIAEKSDELQTYAIANNIHNAHHYCAIYVILAAIIG